MRCVFASLLLLHSKAGAKQMKAEMGFEIALLVKCTKLLPHMTPARLQTIEQIFRAALDQKPEQIGAFLDTACEGDEPLRCKVEALLASHQRAGSFIETSS
ncbi:MAG: hypothetical protein DME43_02250, partial [Verrucomicrobia bacterium]